MSPRERLSSAWACVTVAAWAWAWTWAGSGAADAVAAGLCSDGTAFHSLTAGLNATGHWSASLDLHKDARVQPPRADSLRLDVRPLAALCGDVRTVALTVELTGSTPVIHIASTAPPDASSSAGRGAAAAPPPALGYAQAPPFPGFYKVQERRANWREAQAACEAEGAHLLVVETPQEAQAVAFLLRQHATAAAAPHALTRTLHAGFFATDALYFSVFGELLSDLPYQRWASEEPRHVDICGAVDHAGQLHDAFCSWNVRRSFVCEYGGPPAAAAAGARGARRAVRHPHPTAAPSPAPADSAPFTRVAGAGAFQVRGAENATWAEAQAACQRAGGHLAVVETHEAADALRRHLASLPGLPPQLHVGLFAESRFVTVFGDDLSDSEYQGWAEGEPNNNPCVVANLDLSYTSVGCALRTGFICERTDSV